MLCTTSRPADFFLLATTLIFERPAELGSFVHCEWSGYNEDYHFYILYCLHSKKIRQ